MESQHSKVKVLPKNDMSELAQTNKLSDEQKKYLDENGFLVIKKFIDLSTLHSCKKRFTQLCNGVIEKGSMIIVREPSMAATGATGEDLIHKAHDIHFDDVFSLYTENPRLLDVMSQLIGNDLSVMHSMLINKPPGTSRHPPHQDLFYFPFRPTEWIMAAWTAIDNVDLDNGCLYVIPGSHRHVLHEHVSTPDRFYEGIPDEDAVAPPQQRVHLKMSPGDTVFFHPMLVHGSGPNVSKRYRKAITAHYANSHCHFREASELLTKEHEVLTKTLKYNISYTSPAQAELFRRLREVVRAAAAASHLATGLKTHCCPRRLY